MWGEGGDEREQEERGRLPRAGASGTGAVAHRPKGTQGCSVTRGEGGGTPLRLANTGGGRASLSRCVVTERCPVRCADVRR